MYVVLNAWVSWLQAVNYVMPLTLVMVWARWYGQDGVGKLVWAK